MEKAGIAIPKILEENRLLTPYKLYQAKLSWSSIVGVQIAKYSYIQQFDQKTAVVAVLNSVWMNQLFMHKKQLIEKINTFIHEPYIRDIRFVRSGRKPAAVVYETFEGEEEESFPAENLKNIILPKALVDKIYQETAHLPARLQEQIRQMRFLQEKRKAAYTQAGRHVCPYCGRFLQPGETICYLCRLDIRQKKKKKLHDILIQMPWLTLEELKQHGYIPQEGKVYVELYNEIRRDCIYRYIERIHYQCDTAEDDTMLALFVTRKNPTEMTDSFIHNLAEKYRRKEDVSTHRRQSDD